MQGRTLCDSHQCDEATFYDKQWQASWQDQIAGTGKKIYFASLYKFVLSLCYKKLGL